MRLEPKQLSRVKGSGANLETVDDTLHRQNYAPKSRPLSWIEARSRLRSTLRQYAESKPETNKKIQQREAEDENRCEGSIRNFPPRYSRGYCQQLMDVWLVHNMDLYCGSLLLSSGLLSLSVCSYIQRKRDVEGSSLNPQADLRVYTGQMAGAALLVSGVLFSIVTTVIKNHTCSKDVFVRKKRAVLSFLEEMDNLCTTNYKYAECMDNAKDRNKDEPRRSNKTSRIRLSGTPLSDIYSAYRIRSSLGISLVKEDQVTSSSVDEEGEWHQIPALLLVRGDFVAFQVGDIAPAKCRLVPSVNVPSKDSPPSSQKYTEGETFIQAGERLTQEMLGNERHSCKSSKFPPGRSSLGPKSKDLLVLCNNMRVFMLVESPLKNFLLREDGESVLLP